MASVPAPSNVVSLSRNALRSRRAREVRARVEQTRRLTKYRLMLLAAEAGDYPAGVERPRTRGDCASVPRPCPFAGCRHHMALDVNAATGNLKFNRPGVETEDYPPGESCSLDMADAGPMTLERVGEQMNVTRERVRQLEVKASKHFAESAGPRLSAEFAGAVGDAQNRPGSAIEHADSWAIHGGSATRGKGADDKKTRDADGLTARDRDEVERWSNEVAALLSEGVPLREAQRRASFSFDGPEDPPVCLAPPLPGDERDRSWFAAPEDVDPDAAADAQEAPPEDEHAARHPGGTEVRPMTRGVSESKQQALNARKDAVLAYLKKHGPSAGPAIAEFLGCSRQELARSLQGLRDEGVVQMSGVKNHARYSLAGDERKTERVLAESKSRRVETPAKRAPAVAKVARSATYGTDTDPVEVLRAMRDKLLADASEKAEKLNDAIRALGGEGE